MGKKNLMLYFMVKLMGIYVILFFIFLKLYFVWSLVIKMVDIGVICMIFE